MFQLTVPGDNIKSYMARVRECAILSAEEEHELAMRYKLHNDLEAAHKLVLAHLRYVVFIARKFAGYGIPVSDLIQQGNYGLMTAVQKFDPTKGIRLITFAVFRIKAEIFNYVINNWRIIKVATTKAQRKLFFNLRKVATNAHWLTDYEVRKMANDLDVPEYEVREMESRLYVHDLSFDPIALDEDDEYGNNPVDHMIDESSSIDHTLINPENDADISAKLKWAMNQLEEREQLIIQERYLKEDKTTLTILSDRLNISMERIRQLEHRAIKKLHNLIVES